MMTGDLEEIASRGSRIVSEIRGAASTLDKLLLHEGPELLDLPSTPAQVKQRILDDVERITRLLQLHRYWTRKIGMLIIEARRTRRGKPVRVLDIGAGGGGLLFRIEDWARRRRIPVELFGVEYDGAGREHARRRAAEEGRRVEFRQGDARDLGGFSAGSVDVAVTTFMLHHLPAGDVARVLAELDRVSAVNFFAFDLRRTVYAVPALWALLHLARFDAPSRHDSMVSLRKGYSVMELEALLGAAGVQNFLVTPVQPAFVVASRA
jgi:SAM-dependent methyltransferase